MPPEPPTPSTDLGVPIRGLLKTSKVGPCLSFLDFKVMSVFEHFLNICNIIQKFFIDYFSEFEISGRELYDRLAKHKLTEEQLRENGFPRPDPDNSSQAKVYTTSQQEQNSAKLKSKKISE